MALAYQSKWTNVKRSLRALRHLAYPDLCGACNQALYQQEYGICRHCGLRLPYTHFHRIEQNPVAQLFHGRLRLEHASALFFFEKGGMVQELMHNIKYNRGLAAARQAGRWMGEALLEAHWDVDIIVPVPLHRRKLRQRGYNQSLMIALGVHDQLKIPVCTDALIRSTHTLSQTRQSRLGRWENVGSSFSCIESSRITRKHVLLIDDVVTTGATLEACGMALLNNIDTRLSIASLALAT